MTKRTALRNSELHVRSSTVQISTTWGLIKIERVAGKVIRSSLPFLTKPPEIPFAIKTSGDDVASRFIVAALSGKTTTRPALSKPEGTDFQQQVWQAIARIPAGKTQTYGELARSIDRPRAYRAVANACGKNPLPIFIPCHRVVAANGKMGGFSSGLAWKRHLLSAEQP